MTKTQLTACLLVAGLFLAYPGASLAEGDSDEEAAKVAFKEGKRLFNEGDYAAAANKFRQAYDIRATWKLLYNIAQAEAAARHIGPALEAFQRYLSEGGDEISSDRQEEVLREVSRLRVMVGAVEITGPFGLVIYVDGIQRGTLPLLGPLTAAAGVEHTLEARRGDEVIFEKAFKPSSGLTMSIEIEEDDDTAKEPEAAPATQEEPVKEQPTPPAVEDADDGEVDTLKLLGWITTGVGAGALIGGAITGSMALSLDKELADDCVDGHCLEERQGDVDKLGTLSITTDVLIGVGAAAAAGGVVMLVIAYGDDEETGNAPSARLVPAAGPGFAGAVLNGSF